jgi:hypothetical protein
LPSKICGLGKRGVYLNDIKKELPGASWPLNFERFTARRLSYFSKNVNILFSKVLAETTSQIGVKRVAGSGLVTVANGAERYRQVVFWPRQASHRNYLAAIWP